MATISDHFVDKTNPAPYHQAIFLSQKSINNGFSAMWEAAQDIPNDPDNPDPNQNPLKYFSVPSRTQEYFRFNTGKPEVRLQVTTGGDPMLYFRLRTDNGGLWVFTTEDPNDDTHIDWDIAGFVFAFSVRIGKVIYRFLSFIVAHQVSRKKGDHQRVAGVQRLQGPCWTPQLQLHPSYAFH